MRDAFCFNAIEYFRFSTVFRRQITIFFFFLVNDRLNTCVFFNIVSFFPGIEPTPDNRIRVVLRFCSNRLVFFFFNFKSRPNDIIPARSMSDFFKTFFPD